MTRTSVAAEVPQTTRVTLLTPLGRGALATLSVEGEQALLLVAQRFKPASRRDLESFPLRRIVFGHWQHTDGQQEEAVVCRRTETSIEIHGHGGRAAAESMICSLETLGACRRSAQDWIAAHTADSVQAAALTALSRVRTERAAAVLLDQYRGALQRSLSLLAESYAIKDVEATWQQLLRLQELARLGQRLTSPWRVVCAGLPNAGKSSLINALLGFERTIVHDQPGTTRDFVVSPTALDGWPVELCDTAGLREVNDRVERAGVATAERELATADLVLFVFDASRGWPPLYGELQQPAGKMLPVANKIDLLDDSSGSEPVPVGTIRVSALHRTGISSLVAAIVQRLVPQPPRPREGVPFTPELVEMIERMYSLQAGGDWESAKAVLATCAP